MPDIDLLLLGDWVVDENWVVTRQHSELSSLTGQNHKRALGGLHSSVRAFCGAGRVARILWQLNRYPECPIADTPSVSFAIVGCGLWATGDEIRLHRLFLPDSAKGLSPFALTRQRWERNAPPSETPRGLHLLNLTPALEHPHVGTTRVYREYERSDASPVGLDLERRIDFHLPPQSHRTRQIYDPSKLAKHLATLRRPTPVLEAQGARDRILDHLHRLARIKSELPQLAQHLPLAELEVETAQRILSNLRDALDAWSPLPPKRTIKPRFDYVVVKDLGKGAVDETLVRTLKQETLIGRSTAWFVSSKHRHPDWLNIILNHPADYGRVAAWFLPPKASMQRTHENLPARWFVRSRYPKPEVLQALEKDAHKLRDGGGVVVAMPSGLSLIAVQPRRGEPPNGFMQPEPLLDPADEALAGKASAFFAGLVARMVHSANGFPTLASEHLTGILAGALQDAQTFLRQQIHLFRSEGQATEQDSRAAERDPIVVDVFDWDKTHKDWRASTRRLGTVTLTPSSGRPVEVLQVWRATRDIDNYVETAPAKRLQIARLMRTLDQFRDAPLPVNVNILLKAAPGSGKSYLVSQLAKTLGLAYKDFNITQLVSRADVRSCFDAIASFQVSERPRRCLIFFDEINALVENAHVYDLFLSVLEDGTYARGEQRFRLDPCAWIFASTELLLADDEMKLVASVCGDTKTSEDQLSLLKPTVGKLTPTLPPSVYALLPPDPHECVKELDPYRASKAPDFVSRLSARIALDPRETTQDELTLNYIYAGVLEMVRRNPATKEVERGVLRALRSLPYGTSLRDVTRYVAECRNINSDRIVIENLGERLKAAYGASKKDDREVISVEIIPK